MKFIHKIKLKCLLTSLVIIFIHSNQVESKKKPTSTEKPYDNRELLLTVDDGNNNNHNHNSLLIGAFNLRKFGLPKVQNETILESLVKIVTRYDLIAVSEITDRTEKAIKTLMAKVNYVSEYPYNYAVSLRVGRTNNKEQYGIIYRPDKIQVMNHFLYDDSSTDPFAREPQIAEIKIKEQNEVFALVNIHVKPSDAVKEIDALVEVQDWIENHLKLKDVLILGDLNADCTYVPKKAWKTIRLRTMERFIWLLGDEVDSTVGNTDCAYDRIIMSGSYWHGSVINGSTGPFLFDKEFNLNPNDAAGVSDHYPVEFRLKVGSPLPQEAISTAKKLSAISSQSILPLLSVIYNLFQSPFNVFV